MENDKPWKSQNNFVVWQLFQNRDSESPNKPRTMKLNQKGKRTWKWKTIFSYENALKTKYSK
jgi:hypothetical protein